ncbi:MAG: formylglycine-generating enzyme family protein, partial [Chromatiales bacterium]|nr:formylglycine-generating enzyme family protein [Chromatiales bacterium]
MKRTHGFLALLALCTCASSQAEPLVNGLGMSFLPVPAGSFLMGTADLDEAIFEQPAPDPDLIRDETPAHEVTVTQAFYLGKTEVTQGQWLDLMGSKPGPTEYWNREDWKDLPVVSVTWFQVQEFIDALNQREAPAHYRLPTEAEWEYAA